QCYVSALMCEEIEILGRPTLWRMDDLALGEGQAQGPVAILASGGDDPMVGHARFGLDGLRNCEKSKQVRVVGGDVLGLLGMVTTFFMLISVSLSWTAIDQAAAITSAHGFAMADPS